MISEAVDLLELGSFLGINVYVLGIGTDGNFGSVRIEREGDDGTCEQLMHLWSGHFQLTGRDGSQPLMDQITASQPPRSPNSQTDRGQ
jgi:hypothetical protein